MSQSPVVGRSSRVSVVRSLKRTWSYVPPPVTQVHTPLPLPTVAILEQPVWSSASSVELNVDRTNSSSVMVLPFWMCVDQPLIPAAGVITVGSPPHAFLAEMMLMVPLLSVLPVVNGLAVS